MYSLDAKTLRAIKRECRAQAHEMMLEQYERYDAIWWHRIRISPELYAHGKDVVQDINQRMPNLLTHKPTVCTLDLVAERFGFDCPSDLVDFLLAYTPRGPVEEKFYEQLLAERLTPADTTAHYEVDEVPF